jgi:hypothetical protein
MASIWLSEPFVLAARKLKGHLDLHAAEALLQVIGSRLARKNNAEVTANDKWEMQLRYRDGKRQRFSLWVEPGSPPSAPEPCQPKVTANGQGVLVDKAGNVHNLGLPPKAPEPANG